MRHYIGIDVGTGSARSGIFDERGTLLATHAVPIKTFKPQKDFLQQSTDDIWSAVSRCVQAILLEADVETKSVVGIGFDATCSLVVSDKDMNPVSVDPAGAADQDIILWADHRALQDAEEINKIGGEPLSYVGGRISPEMELPKLRWLKYNMRDAWARAAYFWDLPDWLVYRASGTHIRSFCSTVCKWTYLGHKGQNGEGWDDAFLSAIGLSDLATSDHSAIGSTLMAPGQRIGGLTTRAAQELGLPEGIPVAASLIDAYAGALGTLAVDLTPPKKLSSRLALIAGTSTCHIAINADPVFVPGVWGPYYGVLTTNSWALEGGQSAAGALIDAVIDRHAVAEVLKGRAAQDNKRVTDLLEEVLVSLSTEAATLTSNRHVLPDFHGNRSPLADPTRKGALSGLTLDIGDVDLALDYLATVQALAYGTRHIIEEMRAAGAFIDTLVVSGGLAKNELFLRENADATGCEVIVPDQAEPVLLGSAILGAVASGDFDTIEDAMAVLSSSGTRIKPRTGAIKSYHDRKYEVFRAMQNDFAKYQSMMKANP